MDIYTAGDCPVAYHRTLKRNVCFPHGTTANRMGRIAGLNMAGKKSVFPVLWEPKSSNSLNSPWLTQD